MTNRNHPGRLHHAGAAREAASSSIIALIRFNQTPTEFPLIVLLVLLLIGLASGL